MEIPARALILSCMRNSPVVILTLETGKRNNFDILEVEDKNEIYRQTITK